MTLSAAVMAGWKVIYLGADLPADEICSAVEKNGASIELLHDVHERVAPIDAIRLAKELDAREPVLQPCEYRSADHRAGEGLHTAWCAPVQPELQPALRLPERRLLHQCLPRPLSVQSALLHGGIHLREAVRSARLLAAAQLRRVHR